MEFTYDFYANRWRMCSISYYFRNSSASINNVTNVNYDIDLQKMYIYMYPCKNPQMLCLQDEGSYQEDWSCDERSVDGREMRRGLLGT